MSRPNHQKILLQFNETFNRTKSKIRSELSSIARTGPNIWLAFDEGSGLHRLTRDNDGYGQHIRFALKDYIYLPAGDEEEVDIEGLAYADHYLWVVGSHSLKRDKPDDMDDPVSKRIKCLSKIKNDPNRYTIARVPVIQNKESGDFELFKSHPHPENPVVMLTAAKLKAKENYSELSEELRYDRHLCKFMEIPGKDNGFDIEGIAVLGERVFIGLRGPVLRGYALILEIALDEKKNGKLKLKKIGKDGAKYRKHFVHLQGMGIRELAFADQDLLILAGPTMDCDGAISLYRMNNGPADVEESLTYNDELDQLFHVSLGHETPYGKDKAEGITLTEDHNIMVVYDAPSEERVVGETDAYADIFEYDKAADY
ncbi:MAG: DUF3616 domain-containing protein [Cyclobacteriaceae bacterium]